MKHASRGVTLLELMIAITILGILIGIAVPSFRAFTRNNRATAAQNDLVTALNVARSESMRRSRPVSLCPSTDGETCSADGNWAQGWMVFLDPTGAAGDLDGADDEPLESWPAIGGDLTLDADRDFVQYQPIGVADAATEFDIAWPGCGNNQNRRINILVTGSISSLKNNCS